MSTRNTHVYILTHMAAKRGVLDGRTRCKVTHIQTYTQNTKMFCFSVEPGSMLVKRDVCI